MHYNKNTVLFRNIASLGVIQIVNFIFPLIAIPYVSRIIGPEGFGTINYITAIISYFVLIIVFGFDLTATRKVALNSDNPSEISKIYSEITGSRIILFFICICLFSIILLLNLKVINENRTLAFILFLNVLSPLLTPQYIFQGLQRLSVYSFITLLKGIISIVLIFLLVSEHEDLILYASIGVFSNFMVSMVSLLYVLFVIKVKFIIFPISHYFQVMRESKRVFLASLIYTLYTVTNTIILGFFDNSTNIGFYTTAVSFIAIVQSIINIPLSTSLYPYISKAFADGQENGIDKLQRIFPLVFYMTTTIGLCILLGAPYLITLLYGDKFIGSVIGVQILAFLPLLSSFSGMLGVQTMLNLKMDKLFLKVTGFASVFSVIINVIMAKYYSYIGTSVSYLATEILIAAGMYFTLKNKNITIIRIENFKPQNILLLIKNLK